MVRSTMPRGLRRRNHAHAQGTQTVETPEEKRLTSMLDENMAEYTNQGLGTEPSRFAECSKHTLDRGGPCFPVHIHRCNYHIHPWGPFRLRGLLQRWVKKVRGGRGGNLPTTDNDRSNCSMTSSWLSFSSMLRRDISSTMSGCLC